MFKKWMSVFFLAGIISCVSTSTNRVDGQLGKVVSSSQSKAGADVIIFKQWHLSPGVSTTDIVKSRTLLQSKNQQSIYTQLKHWVQNKELDLVVGEGCEGEIDGSTTQLVWNGWSSGSLNKWIGRPEYTEILTHVPFKLEVEMPSHVRTVCGDDMALVNESGLVLSDVRAAMGYLERISAYPKNPQVALTFLKSMREAYHQEKIVAWPAAVQFLNQEITSKLRKFSELIEVRNQKAIQVLQQQKFRHAAIVFGGLHAKGLIKLLSQKGYSVRVVEPIGYRGEENALLEELDRYLQ